LVGVFGGQSDLDVLLGTMPRPVGHVEADALAASFDNGCELPGQSPW